MFNSTRGFSILVDGNQFLAIQPYKEIPKDPIDLLSEDERCCINKFKKHLSDNSFHYKKAIWLLEDPNERADRFKRMVTGGGAIIDDRQPAH